MKRQMTRPVASVLSSVLRKKTASVFVRPMSSVSASSPVAATERPPIPLEERSRRQVLLIDLPEAMPYDTVWKWQKALLEHRVRKKDDRDVFFLLEHRAVYTLGRGSSLENIKFDLENPPCDLHRCERGGEVTFHGPGQLVGYPILDLTYYKKDLHWYLRSIEEIIIRTLSEYGVEGERDTENTGVWVGNKKLAAIGLNASRWITMHGFALNVNPECLEGFRRIIPCGIHDKEVGTLSQLTPNKQVDIPLVKGLVKKEFERIFNAELVPFDVERIDELLER